MIQRRRLHRAVFVLAGLYNITWGIYAALDPQWLFRYARMAPLNQPAIFACLGMTIGLYGVLYLEVARAPERGFLLAAIGLAGKILGPIGLAVLILDGTWPVRTVVLCVTNDLVWWVPFSLYLLDAHACQPRPGRSSEGSDDRGADIAAPAARRSSTSSTSRS